ncbi:uncharacterized protein [Palaemon carinicauda]|uniref:uncharacterized protein n=1 Tax=Palaemon carinicauda TaxID=392227 RepID=UPI0035B69B40
MGSFTSADATKDELVEGEEQHRGLAKEKVELSDENGRHLVFFDVHNIVNNLFRAMLFYTTGHANIIAPLGDIAVKTPVVGLIAIWLLLLLIFYEYTTGTFSNTLAQKNFESGREDPSSILQDVLESLGRALQHHDQDRDP